MFVTLTQNNATGCNEYCYVDNTRMSRTTYRIILIQHSYEIENYDREIARCS